MDISTLSIRKPVTSQNQRHQDWILSKTICRECQAIFDNWWARDNWEELANEQKHHSIFGLEQSARDGCPTCEVFFSSVDESDPEVHAKDRNEKSIVSVEPQQRPRVKTYYVKLEFKYFPGKALIGYKIEMVPTDYEMTSPMGEISSHTDCPETWDLARIWVESCLESHPSCSEPIVARTLPTRLVYVGYNDSDLHLCVSKDLPSDVKYLTLSHRWGEKEFEKLTRDNLTPFLSSIPVEILTKTFHEAIITTRRLGFQYIWIDSLCIIQDDVLDWRDESVKMESVYANSSLNIGALDALDGDGGCFFEKKTDKVRNWTVNLQDPLENSTQSTWQCAHPRYRSWLLDRAVLQTRAWVCQERFLAPRSIYLGAIEVVWECRTHFACETLPGGLKNGAMTIAGVSSVWRKNLLTYENTHVTKLWSSMIRDYSKRQISFARDKLVALSGVSRLFSQMFHTSYLAGMWREDLVRQLVWYVDEGGLNPRPIEYQAPTWSWASVNSPAGLQYSVIDALSPQLTTYIAIEDVATTPVADPLGQVRDGYLKLKGLKLRHGSVASASNTFLMSLCNAVVVEDYMVFPDIPIQSPRENVFFLTVLKVIKPGESEDLWGLILEKSTLRHQTFSRIGVFRIFAFDGGGTLQNFLDLDASCSCGSAHDIGEPAGVDEDGEELYSITII